MNDDQFDYLKQFIEKTVSQTEERLSLRLDGVEQRLGGVEQKLTDGFAGVAEAIEQIHQRFDEHDARDAETEKRLQKLEHQAAAA